jgi:hypothetical protein
MQRLCLIQCVTPDTKCFAVSNENLAVGSYYIVLNGVGSKSHHPTNLPLSVERCKNGRKKISMDFIPPIN